MSGAIFHGMERQRFHHGDTPRARRKACGDGSKAVKTLPYLHSLCDVARGEVVIFVLSREGD